MRRGVDRGRKIGNVFTKIGARLIGEREGEEGEWWFGRRKTEAAEKRANL